MKKKEMGMFPRKAFTLVELLVVVAIMVVLIGILLPAMEGAVNRAQVAKCAANMRSIAQGAVTYALQNNGVLFICRGRAINISFAPLNGNTSGPGYQSRAEDAGVDWPAALASVGLAGPKAIVLPGRVDNTPSRVWDCPSRPFQSFWHPNYGLLVSYQYFGGIETWINPEGSRPSASPLRLSDGGRKTLVADYTTKWAGSWGGPESDTSIYAAGTPPHRRSPDNRPEGHNQSYLDGSAGWVEADKLIYIHDWYGGSYDFSLYFAQEDLGGYVPGDGQYLKHN